MKVLRGSKLVTIQDLGRKGFRAFGVPLSGVMDEITAGWVNAILGNEPNAAVIEVGLPGFSLESHENTFIAVSGEEGDWRVNHEKISPYKLITIFPGDIISCERISSGNFVYLSVKGGFKTPMVLNSRSMFPNITELDHCATGCDLICDSFDQLNKPNSTVRKVKDSSSFSTEIVVLKAPEFHLLKDESRSKLKQLSFKVSHQISRMGFLMDHEALHLKMDYSMLSSAVLPGTIQLLPNGKTIVLMKDAQTTGGYPRILQLKKGELSKLAQCKPGVQFSFRIDG